MLNNSICYTVLFCFVCSFGNGIRLSQLELGTFPRFICFTYFLLILSNGQQSIDRRLQVTVVNIWWLLYLGHNLCALNECYPSKKLKWQHIHLVFFSFLWGGKHVMNNNIIEKSMSVAHWIKFYLFVCSKKNLHRYISIHSFVLPRLGDNLYALKFTVSKMTVW